MGLFDKKNCDICGEKIGLLGNRKLSDGNLCKDCAKKLSPWFSERRQSSVAEIRAQLSDRETNRARVAAFRVSRSLGTMTKILVDEAAGKFVVTAASDLAGANPDVMELSQVTDCRLDVRESRTELKHKDKDGKDVSYDPPRYRYSYQFFIELAVNHPYISEISFKLNNTDVSAESGAVTRPGSKPLWAAAQSVLNSGRVDPYSDPDYGRFERLGQEICEYMLRRGASGAESVPAAPAAKAPESMVCPFCGATTTPTADGKCEYCDSVIV